MRLVKPLILLPCSLPRPAPGAWRAVRAHVRSARWARRVWPVLLATAPLVVPAQPASTEGPDHQAAIWAASCMACHGTDGKAEGTGMALAGRSAKELYELLLAFKTDRRSGTIMHQHAKGYSDAELQRIALQFSRVR